MSEQNKEIPVDPDGEEVEEFAAEDMPMTPSYVQKMNEFMSKGNIDDLEPTFYLYKYDNYYSGKKKSLIDKYFEGTPPDEHDIGIEYGSGRYLICLVVPECKQYPKGTMRAYRFRVNPVYDKRRNSSRIPQEGFQPSGNQQVAQLPLPPAQPAQTGGTSALLDTFSMIEKLITIIAPLLNRPQQQPDGVVQDMMRDSYSVIGQMMKDSLLENFKMIQEMQKKHIDFIDEAEEKRINVEPQEPSIIEKFAPLLSEWLPKLLGNDTQSKLMQSIVKSAPQVKEIINDSQQLNAIVNYLVEEQGLENTVTILQNLGIPFSMDEGPEPEQQLEQPQTMPLPTPQPDENEPAGKQRSVKRRKKSA